MYTYRYIVLYITVFHNGGKETEDILPLINGTVEEVCVQLYKWTALESF